MQYYVISYDYKLTDAFIYKYTADKKKNDVDALAVTFNTPYFHIEHNVRTIGDIRSLPSKLGFPVGSYTRFTRMNGKFFI